MSDSKSNLNVVFITSDHHRADFMSCAGGPVDTPNLDALASSGIRMDNAYCQAPLCMPSRISMTTGRYPMNTGYFTNRHPIDSAEPTFVRQLQTAGVHTAMIGKLHHHVHTMGCDYSRHEGAVHQLGFNDVHETSGKQGAGKIHCECQYTAYLREMGLLDDYRKWTGRWGDGSGTAEMSDPWPWDPSHTQDAYIGEQGCAFLRRQPKNRPFYLHLGFVGPHPPHDAPDVFRSAFRDPPPINNTFRPDWWSAYLACIREVDEQIGRVLNTVRELGILENTLIIYASDHGDLAGEHGLWGKVHLYQG
jgi:choline-sulfatase